MRKKYVTVLFSLLALFTIFYAIIPLKNYACAQRVVTGQVVDATNHSIGISGATLTIQDGSCDSIHGPAGGPQAHVPSDCIDSSGQPHMWLLTTDASGMFSFDIDAHPSFVNNYYAIRIPSNISGTGYLPPSGYTSPGTTINSTSSYDYCRFINTPSGSQSYECQNYGDLVNLDCGVRINGGCNFQYAPVIPSPTPTSPPAATATPVPTSIPSPTITPFTPIGPAPGITLSINQPPNTLTGRIDLSSVVQFIFNLLVAIGIVAALAYLLYGAIKWITSGGDKAAVEAARSHIVHAVLGLLILVLSWVIVSFVLAILGLGSIPSSITIPSLTV